MKALISASFILLFIASCGSSSKKTYTVTDDNNGTKSPRLKEVVTKTADNNKSEEKITRYTYNDGNLLISKKTSYVQKRKEDEGTQDLFEITYTYTQDKQLKNRVSRYLWDIFNRGGTDSEYTYGDIIYEDTKLPVVDTVTINSRGGTCVYKHTYILNASNLATSIEKITESCQNSDSFFLARPDYNDTRVSGRQIYTKNTQKHTKTDTGYLYKSVTSYNNGLLENIEYYTSSENNTSNYILEETTYYHYENKPYYFKQSPTFIVDLPH